MVLFSHTVKPRGDETASQARHLKLHGSAARRGMAKHGGQLVRMAEKPKPGFWGSRRP